MAGNHKGWKPSSMAWNRKDDTLEMPSKRKQDLGKRAGRENREFRDTYWLLDIVAVGTRWGIVCRLSGVQMLLAV